MQKVIRLDEEPEATIRLKGRIDDRVDRDVSVAHL